MNQKISVVKKEIITNGMLHFALLCMGLLRALFPLNLFTLILSGFCFLMSLATVFLQNVKTDPLDEMTNQYRNEAIKSTLKAIAIIAMLFGLYLLITGNKILIDVSSVLVVVGFFGLYKTFKYAWIERKNSKISEN